MKLTDFNRLKKFMQLATSDNDAEALASLRQANKVLSTYNLNWDSVFDRCVQIEIEAGPTDYISRTGDEYMKATHKKEVEEMFEKVGNPDGRFGDFITSLKEQWEEKQWLSQAQLEALSKAASRARP